MRCTIYLEKSGVAGQMQKEGVPVPGGGKDEGEAIDKAAYDMMNL